MKIWLRLHGYEPCSWTTVWEALREAFLADGDEICDVIEPEEPEEYIELWWGDPQFWSWDRKPVKARIALALSEANSIRAEGRQNVIRNLCNADAIICPSVFATTAFREAPIDRRIYVAQFGVNPTEFTYIKRDWSGDIVFLHAGVTQFRKGSWMVAEAFIDAFKDVDKVKLIIASPRPSPMYTQMKMEYGKHPNIDFLCEREDSTRELYRQSHIYVSPHLSEGFGLMPLEAMATGMAGIIARCSAPREYFSKDYGWWIEMSENYAPISSCLPNTAGFWRLPDIQSLSASMREAYERRDELENIGKKSSEFVLKNMTWHHTATKIKTIIKEVIDEKDFGNTNSI